MKFITNSNIGVSEAIGYILILGIVTTSIGLITAAGLSTLNTAQDVEEDKNITRALEILQSNEMDLRENQADLRRTQVRVDENRISTDEESQISIRIPDPDGPDENISVFTNTVVYEGPISTYRYEFGTTTQFNEESDFLRFLEEPQTDQYYQNTNTLNLELISLISDDESVSGGIQIVEKQMRDRSLENYNFDDDKSIEIVHESNNVVIWADYYEQKEYIDSCTITDVSELTCETIELSNLELQLYDIRLRLV